MSETKENSCSNEKYDVILENCTKEFPDRIEIMKSIRLVSDITFEDLEHAIDNPPAVVYSGVDIIAATALKCTLELQGCEASIRESETA